MKILIEKNPDKIRNLEALGQAEELFNNKTKQGFFRTKGETEFKKFRDSKIDDVKYVELHIKKDDGKGEIKLNGNISYNARSNEIKFYVLSVFEFDNFNYDEDKYVEVNNIHSGDDEQELKDLEELIETLKKIKAKFNPNSGKFPRGGGNRNNSRNGGGSYSRGGSSNGSSSRGGSSNGSSSRGNYGGSSSSSRGNNSNSKNYSKSSNSDKSK